MTWRAFIIGVIGVAGLNLLVPVNDYAVGNTFLTGNHFPVGVVFFMLFLVLVANVLVRLARWAWALRRGELMLVWCMMIVSATVPASGLMRYLLPAVAAPPYMAERADLFWEDSVLQEAPEGLLLSTNPRSVAARQFYQGTPEGERVTVPWGRWAKVFLTWGVFLGFYYLGTLFLFGILRKQWVEVERLTFPLARVPMEMVRDGERPSLVPALFRDRVFLVGCAVDRGSLRGPLQRGAAPQRHRLHHAERQTRGPRRTGAGPTSRETSGRPQAAKGDHRAGPVRKQLDAGADVL